MLKKLLNNLTGQTQAQNREGVYREKYYRYRHAMGLLKNQFPFLEKVVRWVEDTHDYNDLQLAESCKVQSNEVTKPYLSAYDLVCLDTDFRAHLVANDLLSPKSRKVIMYMDRRALDVFFGRTLTIPTVTLTVTDETLLPRLQVLVKSFVERQAHTLKREKVEIKCQYLESIEGYTMIKADLFGNIPCIHKAKPATN